MNFEALHALALLSVCFRWFASSVPVYRDLVHSLTLYVLRRMALDGIRMPDGCYADGTWELKMHVTDLNRDVSLRVTGEIHVGGVMLKLVEKLGTHRKLIVNAFAKERIKKKPLFNPALFFNTWSLPLFFLVSPLLCIASLQPNDSVLFWICAYSLLLKVGCN